MATPPSDKPDLENLSKDELIAMVMAAAEEKKEKACAPHDSAALACPARGVQPAGGRE